MRGLAYLIYTSGSTGRAKGVAIEHRSAVAMLEWSRQAFTDKELRGTLASTSICFDISVFELFAPLVRGGAVILAENALALPTLPAADRVTLINTVPSALRELLRMGDLPPSVRTINLAGEALPQALVEKAYRQSRARRVLNLYGPSEDTTYSTYARVEPNGPPSIGRPIAGTRAYILDRRLRPVPPGVPGELAIGGAGLARGYHRRPAPTAERFVPDPWADAGGRRLYRTGDLVRRRHDGELDFLGRLDRQVKLRGFRIELGEIESALTAHPAVAAAAVVQQGEAETLRLAAFAVPAAAEPETAELRRHLRESLPEYMVPAAITMLAELPLLPNGKVDRTALARTEPAADQARERDYVPPSDELEETLAGIWRELLGVDKVGLLDNFFDAGGHSLLLVQVRVRLRELLGRDVPLVELFRHPTIRALADHLRGRPAPRPRTAPAERGPEIAVVGMSGRFPGAASVDELWRNLCAGVESIRLLSDEELEAAGIERAVYTAPDYVRASAELKDPDHFDAAFFGFTPREAEILDPQHRILLECAWQALEAAGYDPGRYPGRIGLYAGAGLSRYATHVFGNPEIRETMDEQILTFAVAPDFLATRVSYKLGLTGPSVVVQTACSTSLVAVHLARQALVEGECDMALAGGVTVLQFPPVGYRYQEGGIRSPDGHCRSFDARGAGTVFGSGAGVVVLKRLADAVADGDRILAVIKGSAINNDGDLKVGYTAPGLDGQLEVIRAAQEVAGVEPETITYVEAHGTATALGDPIEVEALTRAFRTDKTGFCALGSIKSNIGHTDAAAGVAGLIKAVLAVNEGRLPPSLHFAEPNPEIDFARTPFYVPTELEPWESEPRRAGVSSFGIGGTNAHLILEQAPAMEPSGPSRPWQLLVLSARSDGALETLTDHLAQHLREHPEIELADVAYTLQVGRAALEERRILACRDTRDAAAALESRDRRRLASGSVGRGEAASPVVFLFPGQGVQYAGIGRELYDAEEVFRRELDRCCGLLEPKLGVDLRDVISLGSSTHGRTQRSAPTAATNFDQTAITQPALFALEYSLARLWMSWGIEPAAMLGHSIGEWVAACLAGVFSLTDAAALVATRGRLMQQMPPGAMLAVPLSAAEIEPRLSAELDLAAINAPDRCVIAGPEAAVAALAERLREEKIAARRLTASHAFHSAMMDPIRDAFAAEVRKVKLRAPEIPVVSNLTGKWLSPAEATDPEYWAEHLRRTVRFADGVETLAGKLRPVFLEVGPGRTLAPFVRKGRPTVSSLSGETPSELARLLTALGRLWLAGVSIPWTDLHAGTRRLRVGLPLTPFDRRRYWIDPVREKARDEEERKESEGERQEAVPTAPRRDRIRAVLVEILREIHGGDLDAVPEASFPELGLDSLAMMQISDGIRARLGIAVTFRQMLEDLGTPEALVDYLDEALPPEWSAPQAEPAAAGSDLGSVMAQHVEVLSQQLDLLRRTLGQDAPPPPVPAPQETPAPPAAFGPWRPVRKEADRGLSPRAQEYLTALVRRYTERTAESRRLAQANRADLADVRVPLGFDRRWKELVYPITATRSAGARLWDVDGNEYIDLVMGFGVNLFGHAPPFVTAAIAEQLERGMQLGPQTALAGEVARGIRELTGCERVHFCNTGSEAVLAALRLARTVTGRDRIAFFTGSYHGINDGVLARAVDAAGRVVPAAPGIPRQAVADSLVLEYNRAESLETIARHAGELAAILVEPLQAGRPAVDPREFLGRLRELSAREGIALIFDEMITGFRLHPRGAQGWFDVDADLATYGKVIGGGLPIGVVAGRAELMDAVDGGFWRFGDDSYPAANQTMLAGTFSKHPLALAAARAVIDHLRRAGPELQRRLNERTAELAAELDGVFATAGVPIRTESFGSLWRLRPAPELRFFPLLQYHLIERGVHLWGTHNCFLSTAHSDEDLEQLVTAVASSIAAMQEGELLPGPRRPSPPAVLPLTAAQKALWLTTQLAADAAVAYIEPAALRLRGPLDAAALGRVLAQVVARHQALRAVFSDDGESQRILPRVPVVLRRIDLARLAPADRRPMADACLRRLARIEFDPGTGPLHRFVLLRLAPEERLLALVFHHLITDGWSLEIMLGEIVALYDAARRGEARDLPAPASYRDYVLASSARGDADEAYWLDCFTDPPPAFDPPTDHPRPAIASFAGGRERSRLDARLTVRLQRLGERGTTLPAGLLAGFGALLHRFAEQRVLVVGVPAAGQSAWTKPPFDGPSLDNGPKTGPSQRLRSTAASEKPRLVGYCINMLPIRLELAAGQPFSAYLDTVRRTLVDGWEHQGYPLARLVERLGIRHDPSRPTLVAAGFNLDRVEGFPRRGTNGGLPDDGELAVEMVEISTGRTHFELELNVEQRDAESVAELSYRRDLFDATTIRRLLGHLHTLLDAAVTAPEAPVASLPLLSPSQRQQLLREWNDVATSSPPTPPIHRLFEAQVEASPDAVAVVCGGEQWTYGGLNRWANRLAHELRAQGVGREILVGVCLERSAGMVVALLAVLKAGGAFVPLDPAYPRERLAFMVGDAEISVLVTRERLRGQLPAQVPVTLRIDELGGDPGNPATEVDLRDLAYVIYTSGSTGRPKGVAVAHGALAAQCTAFRRKVGLTPADRVLQLASFNFDVALEQVLPTLISGARVVMPGGDLWLPSELDERIRELRITVANLPTRYWEQWVESAKPTTAPGRQLRLVLPGGEMMPAAAAGRWYRTPLGTAELVNAYGPTEAAITATHYPVPGKESQASWVGKASWVARANDTEGGTYQDPPRQNASGVERQEVCPCLPGQAQGNSRIPIGRPFAERTLHVLDHHGEPVPIGLPGELCIGGDLLARGYLHRPALTAERFIPDPFSSTAGGRLFRTGDRVRMRADANVDYLGRIDDQVKIRGFRIEPGEIEAVLAQHPAVRAAVVTVRDDEGDKRLVAYVVPAETTIDHGTLRDYLRGKLPATMMPAALVELAHLPLLPNGKVDRAALPAPDRDGSRDDAHVPCRTPDEEILAGIWAAVLGVDRVGAEDNFFALGGHSLLATQVISRVRELFAVEVPLHRLFDAPTVGGLAAALEAARAAGRKRIAPPIRKTSRTGPMPLSFAQQRLWFFDQFAPGSALYNIPTAVRLRGRLEIAALAAGFAEIVRRHQVLRTNFTTVDGRPVQIVAEPGSRLPVVDLRRLSQALREAECRRLVAAEARRPFALFRDRLLRSSVLRLADAEHVVLFTVHHIVADGWSMGILLRELVTLYRAFAAGNPPFVPLRGNPSPLPELAIQYADFAVWQRQWLAGEVLDAEVAHWREQLAGAPPRLELTTDRPRPAVETFRGSSRPFALSPQLSTALAQLSREHGVTLFMTLLAGFTVLLGRTTGQRDVVVGTPIAGRHHRELEELIGFFVNTLVLRVQLADPTAGEPSFSDLLARVRQLTLDAYSHQDLPFERLVEELEPDRDPGVNPLFQVMLTLAPVPREIPELADVELDLLAAATATAKFDLTLSLGEPAAGLRGELEYKTALFDDSTMARLASHFTRLLAAAVRDPGRRLAELPWWTAEERQQLLTEWNDTASEVAKPDCVLELFAARVERAPDAVAVVFEDQRLSYRELDGRADQLARHLRAHGVEPDVVVGLAVERSPQLVVSILGILKAGGAWLPLDPEYPPERLALIAADAHLSLILTREKLPGSLPEHAALQLICPDSERRRIAAESTVRLASRMRAENIAYVIYTSGSTGRPKGVMVPHRGLANLATAQIRLFDLRPGDRTLQFASLSFDASVSEIAMTLAAGASLHLAPQDRLLPGSPLVELLRRQQITCLTLPPSALAVLGNLELPALRTLIVAGEACSPELARQWSDGRRFYNAYGPTETAVCATGGRYLGGPRLPIGTPIANVRLYLLDRRLEIVPAGTVGEIAIAGAGVARGYLERPASSAERFLPDPFAAEPGGGRLYRTGDLARHLSDGTIEFLGRIDHQVKIRGYRVELGEIEAVLGRHLLVRDVVVAVREQDQGEKRLVAYVVEEPGAGLGERELRVFLSENVPDYMVPGAFVFLDALPLTAHGKVDRRALPAPEWRSQAGDMVAASNPTEEILAGIWADVLGIEGGVSVEDNFFDLGGHSLLATQVMAAIERAFSLELPVSVLFEGPTVRELATILHRQGTPSSPLVVIQKPGTRLPLFCVHPSGGNVICFGELALALGSDQPVYGLQARGLIAGEEPRRRVEEMAAAYLPAVRLVQPQGPYVLLGYSLGGLVAYEMAQQLRAEGQEVPLVVILDIGARMAGSSSLRGSDAETMLATLEGEVMISPTELAALDPDAQLAAILEAAQEAGSLPPEYGMADARRYLDLVHAAWDAIDAYEPRSYPGRVALFRPRDQASVVDDDKTMGWGETVAGPLEVHRVPGAHVTMVKSPHVQVLAEQLRQLLEAGASTVDADTPRE